MVAAARRSTVGHGIARVLMLESRALKTANALIARTTNVNPSTPTANAQSCHQKCEASTHIKLNTNLFCLSQKKRKVTPICVEIDSGRPQQLNEAFSSYSTPIYVK
jgi:hypothetical protein